MEVVERMKGKRIVKSIVYGNTATPFGYKRESDQHTHQWTVFLKMFNDDDPSDFIRKVQFKLHDSYAVNSRVCEKPPYEVTETGWGEFEVTVFHYLRLFQPVVNLPNGTTQVIAEHYDEIVFQEPTIPMYKALTSGDGKKHDRKKFHADLMQMCRRSVQKVNAAKEEIQKEIDDLREALRAAHNLSVLYKKGSDPDSNSSTPDVTICQ
ncbi:hypothetical protein Q1695_006430 [Nippostrongylus brasiliensis]|nr:hypothetical protein Q1695_006430 [Nippostrongylus brasiliensis]